ncbi:DUF5134 domain-containing protein [Mycolicibacterium sp. CH28]|uniref:DUF5134 domain-containing protein n=1 Tax=Mycolicibacterium sp. CH28 TaxID=2512237 RepID=UPI001080673A|nr:DUF5134 domain-containing protein [Mycolicibacterium sp. CH28]TGD87022.1 DUF5134 domain-containing protein [Mycolicibacterium sp. CH28]
MIQDLTLRWVVTLLFVGSAAECLVSLALGHRRWPSVVGHVLHAVMAVAMAVMAWPWGAELPTVAPMVFFLLATAWFVGVTLTPQAAGHRIAGIYHALMMLAMAWMYAVMNGSLLPGQSGSGGGAAGAASAQAGQSGHAGHAGHAGMNMPGMDMSGMDMPAADSSGGGGYPAYITTLNWVCTIGFALAAVFWLYRYLSVRMNRAHGTGQPLGILCQAMMAAGMAIMFGVML